MAGRSDAAGSVRFGRILAVCLVWRLFTPVAAGTAEPKAVLRVAVDPRVELMSLVFRLAGNPEYCQGRVPSYVRDVEDQFGPFRHHRVVELAQQFRRTRGVSYDAVMSLAVHLTDASTLGERTPLDPRPRGLDSRWPTDGTREFLAALREFVKEANFDEFLRKHRPLYRTAQSRLEAVVREHGHLEWFDEFFGKRHGARFLLVPAVLNGPSNYGVCLREDNGNEEIFAILGVWEVDAQGQPRFDPRVLATVIHEFGHSYTNAIIDAHSDELRAAGEKLFPPVQSLMGRQGYGNWKTMFYESLLRACVVRYTERYEGETAGTRLIAQEERRGFHWTGALAALLADYESHRKQYPALDAFAPRIVALFNDYAEKQPPPPQTWTEQIADFRNGLMGEPAQGAKKTARAEKANTPHVVSTTPSNAAADVDPELKAITVVFDRPMADRSWSLVRISPYFPETTGPPSYDAAHKVWTIPVRLKPGERYEFMLNGNGYLGFRSQEGRPLEPVRMTFQTRP